MTVFTQLLLLLLLTQQPPDFEAKAKALITSVFVGDVDAATAMLTPPPPANALKQVRDQLTGQLGSFKSITSIRFESAQGLQIATVSCAFDKSNLNLMVAFNATGNIVGFRVAPGLTPAWSPPPYVDLQKFDEKALTLGSAPWQLPATLTLPKGTGPFPVVVLVHGSGPGDEDETIGAEKPFKDIAWGLASNGVAVLRYKKRTLVHGAQMSKGTYTVMDETVDDARAAVAMLGKMDGIDSKRIIVLGHSLGGMLGPRITMNTAAAGLVIMAGSTRPLEELLVDQLEYLSRAGFAPQSTVEAARRSRKEVQDPNLSPTSMVSFSGAQIPGSYWLDLRAYDAAATAATLKIPMLIIRGDRDYQVSAADDDGWKKTLKDRNDLTFKLYQGFESRLCKGNGALFTQRIRPTHPRRC